MVNELSEVGVAGGDTLVFLSISCIRISGELRIVCHFLAQLLEIVLRTLSAVFSLQIELRRWKEAKETPEASLEQTGTRCQIHSTNDSMRTRFILIHELTPLSMATQPDLKSAIIGECDRRCLETRK